VAVAPRKSKSPGWDVPILGTAPANPDADHVRLYVTSNREVGYLTSDGGFAPIRAKTRNSGFVVIPAFSAMGDASLPPAIHGLRSGTGLVAGSQLLELGAYGVADTGLVLGPRAAIRFESDGTWPTATDTPTRIKFFTTPDGDDDMVERVEIGEDGVVTIGVGGIGGLVAGGTVLQSLTDGSLRRLDHPTIYRTETLVTTPSSTAAQTLFTYSVPAGQLAANGQRLLITAGGDFQANSGTPTWIPTLNIGALALTAAAVSPGVNANRRQWYLLVEVVRLTSATQAVRGLLVMTNTSTNGIVPMATTQTYVIGSNAGAHDLTTAMTVSFQSTFSVANAANNMRLHAASIQHLRV
jgi:hypothetical protein